MNDRTSKAVAFLAVGGTMSFIKVLPVFGSVADAPAVAWLPELTIGLVWGVSGVVAALTALTGAGIDRRDDGSLPWYAWGFAGLLVATLVLGLGFGYLTGDFARFAVDLVAPIVGLAVIAYFALRRR
ncbi:hypothetical protein GOC74_01895 [Halomicrobium mukohataei]|uniref:Uncharacterized protein n=1 Tax=Halomicrobium mukohataei TaxID=57705 RepID=A0A847UB48_9EURY|nr:hypothetical protein [Halomicrobium mukohataei]NLV08690.1 hypothetical protein [Halomicrobium mukohataei]